MVAGKAQEKKGPRRQAASEHKFQEKERFRRNLVFRNSHGHFQHVDININSSPGEKKTFLLLCGCFYFTFSRLSQITQQIMHLYFHPNLQSHTETGYTNTLIANQFSFLNCEKRLLTFLFLNLGFVSPCIIIHSNKSTNQMH